MLNIYNPATEELLETLETDQKEILLKKFELLKHGQKIWEQKPLKDRISCIKKFSDLLEEHKSELSLLLTKETGKPLKESENEIDGAKTRIDFFLKNSEKILIKDFRNEENFTKELISFEPLGVIAYISAWNYPYLIFMNVGIPALIAGNAVLYKPSEFSTLTGLKIQNLLHEAGIPKNVFITTVGGREVGNEILNLELDGYFFTGSYNTGKAIAEKVGKKMVPIGMELGGKDPLYVTDDLEDIKKTAKASVEGAFYNNGQSCCAVERIYVHKNVYNNFLESFLEEVKKLKVGNPEKESNITQGAITRPAQLKVFEEQVKDAVAKGGRVLLGGKTIKSKGYFFEPTVVVNVNHTMKVMTEETFGPVIGIQQVSDDKEAISLMNDTEYGLTASVFCKNLDRAEKILDHINTGTSYINCCDRVSPHLPWSGRKHSGVGSTLSYLGVLTFVKPKAWHVRS